MTWVDNLWGEGSIGLLVYTVICQDVSYCPAGPPFSLHVACLWGASHLIGNSLVCSSSLFLLYQSWGYWNRLIASPYLCKPARVGAAEDMPHSHFFPGVSPPPTALPRIEHEAHPSLKIIFFFTFSMLFMKKGVCQTSFSLWPPGTVSYYSPPRPSPLSLRDYFESLLMSSALPQVFLPKILSALGILSVPLRA